MKKRTKELAALFMAAAMLLTGCGAQNAGNTESKSSVSESAAAGEEKPAEESKAPADEKPEEITIMVWDRGDAAPGTTADDNALTKWMQEQVLEECNVKVNFMPVPHGDSDDKINVMMAGGTAPDLVYTYSRSLFLDYASKGGLCDMSDAVEAYGPNIKEYVGDAILDLCNIDGRLYGISATGQGDEVNKHNMYIRKDWLDALGMEVPSTKQEFIDVLTAFKEKDPGKVGDRAVPWAVSGKPDTERHFVNFVHSYADEDQWDDKAMTVYEGYLKMVKPGTKEGFRVLNQMYNDGLLSPDFAVDTAEDKYKQDVTSGFAGVCVEDGTKPIEKDWYDTIQSNASGAEWVPVACFENYEGKYTRPAVTQVQKTMMIPKTSEDKVEAVVKFLDWAVRPEIAAQCAHTPVAELDGNDRHIPLTKDEKYALGYPNSTGDYNLLNRNFYNITTREERVAGKLISMPYFTEEYFNNFYDVAESDIYYEPVFKKVLDSSVKYETNLNKLVVELAYKVVSAPVADFDKVYDAEYEKLVQAGLNELLTERGEYYDAMNK